MSIRNATSLTLLVYICIYIILVVSGKKPNIPLPSIVPKAETLENDQQDDVGDLFSPSSPHENVHKLLEQSNEEDKNVDQTTTPTLYPDSDITDEQLEGLKL